MQKYDSELENIARSEISTIIEQIENKLSVDFDIAYAEMNQEFNKVLNRLISPFPFMYKIKELNHVLQNINSIY